MQLKCFSRLGLLQETLGDSFFFKGQRVGPDQTQTPVSVYAVCVEWFIDCGLHRNEPLSGHQLPCHHRKVTSDRIHFYNINIGVSCYRGHCEGNKGTIITSQKKIIIVRYNIYCCKAIYESFDRNTQKAPFFFENIVSIVKTYCKKFFLSKDI